MQHCSASSMHRFPIHTKGAAKEQLKTLLLLLRQLRILSLWLLQLLLLLPQPPL